MTARDENRRRLRAIIKAHNPHEDTDKLALTVRISQIVVDAENGNLSHTDSLILGAFAVSVMRDCV